MFLYVSPMLLHHTTSNAPYKAGFGISGGFCAVLSVYSSLHAYTDAHTMLPTCYSCVHAHASTHMSRVVRTLNIRCIFSVFGMEFTKCTVIYGAYIWFWPTLHISTHLRLSMQACTQHAHTYTYTNTTSQVQSHTCTHTHILAHTQLCQRARVREACVALL